MANSIRKILVPLDGSEITRATVPYAAGLARAANAGLVLIQVVEDGGSVEASEDYLEQIASDLRDSGAGVATDSVTGEIAPAIVKAAKRYEADIIVMTGHATEQGRKDLLGSTAHSVLKICSTPVLIVPLHFNEYSGPSAIIVGYDGTVNSQRVLDPTVMMARSVTCELVLVQSVDPVSGLGGAAKYYSAVDDFAEEDLKALRNELSEHGCNVSTHVGNRPAEIELLAMADARPGSIIAVSTRSLSDQVNVLGSTTDRLVRSQAHAVLAVPDRTK